MDDLQGITNVVLTLIQVDLSEPLKPEEVKTIPTNDIFGEKAKSLEPIVPIIWRGKKEKKENDKNIVTVTLEQGIKFELKTKEAEKGKSQSQIIEWINEERKVQAKTKEQESIQSPQFCVIDITLEEDLRKFKTDKILDVLNLLSWYENPLKDYDPDVYKKIGFLMENDSLFNLSSLKNCFISVSPTTVLIVRNEVEDKNVRSTTLEAATAIAICFIGYSRLLQNLAGWERKVFQISNKNEQMRLEEIVGCIKELIKYNYQSSSLLEFSMSYVTSSTIAQNFYKTFVSISGLKELQESLTTKLKNSERLLNYLIDYHQFKEIQALRD